MDPKLFLKWYSLSFIPAVKEKQEREGMNGKVILLLDDAPAYPALQQLNDVNPNFEVQFILLYCCLFMCLCSSQYYSSK